MKKTLPIYLLLIALLSLSSCASIGGKNAAETEKPMSDDEKFQKINLITKKLHDMHESNEELKFLEREGMKKTDVNRIRRALDKKIDQLTDETVDLIEAL